MLVPTQRSEERCGRPCIRLVLKGFLDNQAKQQAKASALWIPPKPRDLVLVRDYQKEKHFGRKLESNRTGPRLLSEVIQSEVSGYIFNIEFGTAKFWQEKESEMIMMNLVPIGNNHGDLGFLGKKERDSIYCLLDSASTCSYIVIRHVITPILPRKNTKEIEFDNRNRSYDRSSSGRTNRSRSPFNSTYSNYRKASRLKGGRNTSHTYRRDDPDKHESTRYPSRTDTYFGTGQQESTAKRRVEKTGNLNSRDRKINAAVEQLLLLSIPQEGPQGYL